MNDVPAGQDNEDPQDNLGRVKRRVSLELLIATDGQTVAFREIDRAATGDALRLVGKADDPREGDDRHDDQESTDKAQTRPASRYQELRRRR